MRIATVLQRILLLALLVILGAQQIQAVYAENTTWRSMGMSNGYSICVDPLTPSTLYVTSGNLYKSTNGGLDWGQLSNIPSFTIYAIDPSNPSVLYGGSALSKSTNGGGDWTVLPSNGISETGIYYTGKFVIDPTNNSTLYLGTSTGHIYKSSNGGANWTSYFSETSQSWISAIVFDPLTSGVVYVGTSDQGIFKTVDAGQNWGVVNTGLTSLEVLSMAIDPQVPNTVYASTGSAGVFKSTDGGNHWAQVNTGITVTRITSLAINPATPATLYATGMGGGVYKTTDGGDHWNTFNEGLADLFTSKVLLDPLEPSVVYAGSWNGLYTTGPINNTGPHINSISPQNATVIAPGFTLTVNGTGFTGDSTIQWDSTPLTTTYVSDTQLTAQITALALSKTGTVLLTVKNPGEVPSNWKSFKINNPVPEISSVTPVTAMIGTSATLTVTGERFVEGAVVTYDYSPLATTFVSSTQLTAILPSQPFVDGDYIRVQNPAPGGGDSSTRWFNIIDPTPTINSISPTVRIVGSGDFLLTVNGNNFDQAAVISIDGSPLATTFFNTSKLTATVPAVYIAELGTASITVSNPAPVGKTSNSATLKIAKTLLTITSLSPESAYAGGQAFTLYVNGSDYVNGAVVKWGSTALSTTFISSSQVSALVSASLISATGTVQITVINPGASGDASNAVNFSVENPSPSLSTISPTQKLAGSAGFVLTVSGSGFNASSVIYWEDTPLTTTYISSSQLATSIPATELMEGRNVSVIVTNPAPGGGSSSIQIFQVYNPTPSLTGINPDNITITSADTTLAVSGSGFMSGSVVYWDSWNSTQQLWNSTPLTTTYVSPVEVNALVPSGLLGSTGTVHIKVFNPHTSTTAFSNVRDLSLVNPLPVLSEMSPSTVLAGSPAFTLTVLGNHFLPNSVVYWGVTPLSTTFVSSGQLTAEVPTHLLQMTGKITITVANPAPGGGNSNGIEFTKGNTEVFIPLLIH